MGFKLLQLIFNIGRFLALTPSSTKTQYEPIWQKIYILVFFILITSTRIYSACFNNSYKDQHYVKNIIFYASELILDAFNIYTMIVLNFWKKRQWYQFLNNLKIVEKGAVVETHTNRVGYVSFFMIHLIYIVIDVYYIYKNFVRMELHYFVVIVAEYGQQFLNYFYNFLLYTLANMLLMKYRQLTYLLTDYQKNKAPLETSKIISLMSTKKIGQNICLLRETIDIFNDMFGWTIAFVISSTVFGILDDILHILFDLGENIGEYVISVTEEAEKIWDHILMLQLNCSYAVDDDQKKLYDLTIHIGNNIPEFTAAGFFHISKSTALSILATVINFLIVAIQLIDN
ncbi:7tm 7 domain containing protein [Asbolus verrucosus]|uniref:7tm 7 domain containing protein n=1 Tax=Asbolus verrucosus TaxID=1661398 RepID=A0A482WDR4_ASBVE|nr:7tm 7 domain containing protein [Asbolus verrucosus]